MTALVKNTGEYGPEIVSVSFFSKSKSSSTWTQKIKVWWYLLHVAMEDPSVRKNGFVLLTNLTDANLKNFDTQWALGRCTLQFILFTHRRNQL